MLRRSLNIPVLPIADLPPHSAPAGPPCGRISFNNAMARVYANVNARLGPGWYDYGEWHPCLSLAWGVGGKKTTAGDVGGTWHRRSRRGDSSARPSQASRSCAAAAQHGVSRGRLCDSPFRAPRWAQGAPGGRSGRRRQPTATRNTRKPLDTAVARLPRLTALVLENVRSLALASALRSSDVWLVAAEC